MKTMNSPQEPASHQDIASQLRRRIVQGKLLPGAQLPTLRTIADTFSASPVTAQRALHQLRREGFIYSSGRLGTFVCPRPPHLARYALVFPVPSNEVRASKFWQSLSEAAATVESKRPGTFHVCYDIGHHRQSEGFLDLLERLQNGGIAGIIFASNPYLVEGSALLTQPNVARVAIMTDPYGNHQIPAVYDDLRSFVTRGLDYFAARGRKRLAIIGPTNTLGASYEEVTAMAAKRGIEIRPHWIQHASIHAISGARQSAMLLSHADMGTRPDSLFVLDDHFVDAVTQGLIATGTRVRPAQGLDMPAPDRSAGHTIDVVTLCHFANPPSNPLGFAFLGFDADQLLAACVEQIVLQRRGEKTTPLTLLPARFAFEPQPVSRIPAILEQLLLADTP
jgi:DNA-binding transcriptional regulator YhcF (GntR family)